MTSEVMKTLFRITCYLDQFASLEQVAFSHRGPGNGMLLGDSEGVLKIQCSHASETQTYATDPYLYSDFPCCLNGLRVSMHSSDAVLTWQALRTSRNFIYGS